MTEDKMTPLRERMIEDMRIRGMGDKAQKSHIRAIKDFAKFLRRSPDTARPEELRAYQLHMTDTGVTASTFNTRIVALRFFFGMTCGREDMKRFMQFRTQPRKLPVVFSVEEVSDLLMATPGPGLKYRAALCISYGAGPHSVRAETLHHGPHRKSFTKADIGRYPFISIFRHDRFQFTNFGDSSRTPHPLIVWPHDTETIRIIDACGQSAQT